MARLLAVMLIAALGAGCSLVSLDRPTVVCPDAAVLTQQECARAVEVARLVMPQDQRDFTRVNVETRCRPDPTCPQGVAAIVLTFSASGGSQTFVRVSRDTWRAEVFTPTPPPVPAGPVGAA